MQQEQRVVVGQVCDDDSVPKGGTRRVTLRKGNERLECRQILIWDEEEAAEDGGLEWLWDEWLMEAQAGTEGYRHWVEN